MAAQPVGTSQWAVRLACSLLKAQHGSIPEAVCRHLATRGLQALPDIIRGTALPTAQIKQALLLLIQHNYVAAYTHRDEEDALKRAPKPPVVMYKTELDAILQILRRPRFLLHIEEEHGEQAGEIVQLLLENGRLTFDQLVKAVSARHDQPESDTQEIVRNVLMALVNAHYVERAPPRTLRPPQQRTHPNACKTRRGSNKPGSASIAAEQAQALRGLEELRYDHLRFKLPSDLLLAGLSAEAVAAGNQGGTGGSSHAAEQPKPMQIDDDDDDPLVLPISSKKRKRVATALEESATDTESGEDESPTQRIGKHGEAARSHRGGRGSRGGKAPANMKPRMKAGTKKAAAAAAAGEVSLAALKARAEEEAGQLAAQQDGATQVLWRVNTEEFNRRFRHAVCVDMAKDRFDGDTATVLEAMLAAGRQYETQLREERGAQLGLDEVSAHLRRIYRDSAKKEARERAAQARYEAEDVKQSAMDGEEAGSVAVPADRENKGGWEHEGGHGEEMFTLSESQEREISDLCDRVPTIINTLCNDPLEFVSYVGEGPVGSLYCVNTQRFLDNVRLKHLEAAARERYGQAGLRIFRMLTLRGQLEQKQVGDFAMLPAKDTRELLYRMLKQGFVFLQDIPKTSDRAPSRTFYTWRTDWGVTADRYACQLYQAAGNVFARSQHELKNCKELVDMVEAAQATGNVNFNLTAAQREQLQRLQKSLRTLETCLIHMDESIALFSSY